MNAIQQRCRPKHQVLVLKCYPRTTKGAVDVKPNSSELSYLLYYAASRKSKFQKVGSFLEKKTASDVWRLRIGNVQVTLQILEALIEKNPKDLPLFAPSVLKILDLVLKSNDILMVESSTATFEAFCANHDTSSLYADNAYLKQYESIVRQYASLASTRGSPGKAPPSKPVAMRWRNTGLEAIRSVASSDALSSVSGRQYEIIVPMILENLWTDNEDFLEVLLQRAHMEERVDTESLLKRRTSVATVRTAETGEPNPIALSGSAMDVDKLAEEDIGVLAMQCLKQIFIAPNRVQIRSATLALLRFIEERVNQDERVVRTHPNTGRDSGWAIKMFGLISRWAPVQERYVILVTTMDALTRIPLCDETLQQHIVLVAMAGALLRSEVNLIGLSVMDVLLGLMQHMKRLVQLPGDPSSGINAGVDLMETTIIPGQPDPRSPTTLAAVTAAETTAARRKELLSRIQQTIGDLATHVYYADQISDMISAILGRLKPARSSSPANSSPHGERAEAQASSASAGGAQQQPPATASGPGRGPGSITTDESHIVEGLFSLTVAKTSALKAIKSILLVANPRTKMAGNLGLARNKVPIQVWEGTQWLLRDPDGLVRKAYADALLTWLDRETTKADLKARDENALPNPRASMRPGKENIAVVAKRAASSASTRKETKPPRCHFLNLLHVAIYDNALQFVDYESDIVLLHVLLAKLVCQLGINAVRYGLPMVFRLQEDIQDAELPISKVRLGSLVHGYFWVLTEKFDFEVSMVGRAIHNEIIRRRSKHFWVEGVHVPPPLLELVGTPGLVRPQPKMPLHKVESEALLPFDDRFALVDCICTSYQEELAGSPPASPSASPGRSFTHPMLSSSLSNNANSHTPNIGGGGDVPAEREVPAKFREAMYAEWARETVLAAVQAGSKSASLSGSRTGTTGTATVRNNRLAALNGSNGAFGGGGLSPNGSQQNIRPSSQPAPTSATGPGGGGGLAAPALMNPTAMKLRKSSLRSNLTPSPTSSAGPRGAGGGFVTSVDQLKMVLAGQIPAANLQAAAGGGGGGGREADDSDDSLVSYDMASSEASFSGSQPPHTLQQQSQQQHQPSPLGPTATAPGPSSTSSPAPAAAGPSSTSRRSRSLSRERKISGESFSGGGGPLNSNPTHEIALVESEEDEELVPPVPPLPSNIVQQESSLLSTASTAPSSSSARPQSALPQLQSSSSHPPFLPPVVQEQSALRPAVKRSLRSRSGSGRPGTAPSGPAAGGGHGHGHQSSTLSGSGASESFFASSLGSAAAESVGGHARRASGGAMDLQSLLSGIDSRAGEHHLGNVTRPPY